MVLQPSGFGPKLFCPTWLFPSILPPSDRRVGSLLHRAFSLKNLPHQPLLD